MGVEVLLADLATSSAKSGGKKGAKDKKRGVGGRQLANPLMLAKDRREIEENSVAWWSTFDDFRIRNSFVFFKFE